MITAFVAGIAAALLVAAGLVIDGGTVLASRRQANGLASAAARAGAQELDTNQLRASGTYVLDATRATNAARAFLARDGEHGVVTVNGDRVTVTIHLDQDLTILKIAGLSTSTVTGKATARLVHGVTEADT